MRSFLSLRHLSCGVIEELLEHASHLKRNPHSQDLLNKVVGLVFMNPSLRTLASMQAGISQLGGSSFVIQPGHNSWNLEFEDGAVMDGDTVEHVKEAIPVLGKYCDILGIRSFALQQNLAEDLEDRRMELMAELSPVPLVNLESASDHPCQALADWLTIDECGIGRSDKFVLSWAFHPKPLPFAVPRAALSMAAQRGMEIVIHGPQGYELPDQMMGELQSLGARSVQFETDRKKALQGARVLYCKSWVQHRLYGDPEKEMNARSALREDWCVREKWFEDYAPQAKFMHCLPVRRNVKVEDRVLDSDRSIVVQQAENRLHVQKAVLARLAQEVKA